MRIWLKPDRMLAYKISAEEVMEALSSNKAWKLHLVKPVKAQVKGHSRLNMY